MTPMSFVRADLIVESTTGLGDVGNRVVGEASRSGAGRADRNVVFRVWPTIDHSI